jgi:hypothetical protein
MKFIGGEFVAAVKQGFAVIFVIRSLIFLSWTQSDDFLPDIFSSGSLRGLT